MSKSLTISLDAMGGDFGAEVVVPAAVLCSNRNPDLSLILVGDEKVIRQHLANARLKYPEKLSVHHATQVVEMDEPPALALRGKKDSSMRVSINLVKEGKANAAVSAGNTGALMATARFVLKTLPGIDRPAIMTTIPAIGGHTHMLDLGANVDSSAEHLHQFAIMGYIVANEVFGESNARVGLLNIGEEDIKGNDQVKQAHKLLKQDQVINYIGYVEGDDIFKDSVDVVVADGFVGNVSLKTMEGLAKLISHFMKEAFNKNIFTKMVALLSLPVLNSFKKRVDPRRYNGASMLGLRGIVIKSHGGADVFSFANAIEIAMAQVEHDIPNKIKSHLEAHIG